MGTLIGAVEDVFSLAERGCVVLVGLDDRSGVAPKPGDRVLLKRPDGSEMVTTVRGVDHGVRREDGGAIGILLAGVTKADVPAGTELRLA
jgi:translation elongation factor EF-Tu-like GTPase